MLQPTEPQQPNCLFVLFVYFFYFLFFVMDSWSLIYLTCLTQLQQTSNMCKLQNKLSLLLMFKLSQLWSGRGFSLWLLLAQYPNSLIASLLFIMTKYPGYLLHFHPQPGVSHFSKKMVFGGHNLKMSSVYYYWVYYCF